MSEINEDVTYCSFCSNCGPSSKFLTKDNVRLKWDIIDLDKETAETPLSFDDYLSPAECLDIFRESGMKSDGSSDVFFCWGHRLGFDESVIVIFRDSLRPWVDINRQHPFSSWPAIKKDS